MKNSDSCIKIETEPFPTIYEVSSEIGRGKFAVVKRCKHKRSGTEFAAKFIRKRRKGVDCRRDVLHEINMLHATISHPHFVNLVEVYESANEMILVTELIRGGELFHYISTEGQIDEACTVSLLKQILHGLVFLHGQNIAHLDIKPQNILLTKSLPDCNIKLCDLGLARVINKEEDLFEIIGTPDYVAPEILDYQKLNAACDMWSIGVLAYVMLSGCSPFAGDTNQETFLNISQVNLDFPNELFKTTSMAAVDFIKKLLLKEPGCRLTAEECLDHPWLKNQIPSILDPRYESTGVFDCDGEKETDRDDRPGGEKKFSEDSTECIISDDESPTKIGGRLDARPSSKPNQALHELQNMELLPPGPSRRIWSNVSSENWEPSGIPA